MDDKLFGLIPGGFYAVDSFFFLSGLLTFYLLTEKLLPKKGWAGFYKTFLIYFHRYYRLIFPLVFVTLFTMYIMRYIGDGPMNRNLWDGLTMKNCNKYWWTNFLFINNLYPWDMGAECIGWVWYLANDFQFFIISPPIIYAYCKNRIAGYMLIGFLIFVSMMVNGILTLVYNIGIDLSSNQVDGMTLLYSKPWGRMGAYFVGALFGLTFFEYRNREKYPQFENTVSTGMYEKLQKSRITSVIVATVGILFTALMVFPLRNFYVDCKSVNPNDGGN